MKNILFLFLALGLAPASVLAGEEVLPAANSCYGMNAPACEVFHRTNAERQRQGLPVLQFCVRCLAMAQEQSEDMVERGYFDHQRPAQKDRPAESFSQRAARFGLSNGVGENIALNQSAQNAVARWMNSPGHRRNILSPKYDSFAAGVSGGMYTQVFWNSRTARNP